MSNVDDGRADVKRLRGFAAGCHDFVVGDDAIGAGLVVLGLAGTYALHLRGVDAWWLPPLAAAAALLRWLVAPLGAARGSRAGRR